MDRETLVDAIARGPIEVAMNDGDRFVIQSSEFCIVDDTAAHVLYRAVDGRLRTKIASLVCMTTITPLDNAPL